MHESEWISCFAVLVASLLFFLLGARLERRRDDDAFQFDEADAGSSSPHSLASQRRPR